MITFNELSSRIANTIGKPNDHTLREKAKAAFKDVFAARIRQSIAKNGIDSVLALTINVPIVLDYDKLISGFIIYKTTSNVPSPLRFGSDSPFIYIGVNKPTDDLVPFSFRNEMEIKASLKRKLGGLDRYYTHEGSTIRLYIKAAFGIYSLNSANVRSTVVRTIFEDLEEVASFLTTGDVNNYPIPYPRDMIESILQEILKTEFNYNIQETEIKS